MWAVYESKKARKSIARLQNHVAERYDLWKNVVIYSSPVGLRENKGFRDHALFGLWEGYRASRLNDQFRVVYQVNASEALVEVEDVTPHDYRRK